MRSFRILSAVYNPASDHLEVAKELTDDDGSTSLCLHIIHPETLEWHAAEYDIDDVDELVELVLHEPFIEDVQPLSIGLEEAKTRIRARVLEAKTRLASPIVKDKEEHKNRLRAAGVDSKYVEAADEEPLDVIKQHCPFDGEVVAVKREHVAKIRNSMVAQEGMVAQKLSSSERVAALRRNLRPSDGSDQVSRPPHTAATEKVGAKLQAVELHGKGKRG